VAADRPSIDETRLAALGEVLRRASGLSISPGMRRGLPSAVADVAAGLGEPPAVALCRLLEEEPIAVEALVERTVVGETSFWRHPEQLRALRQVAFGAPEPLSIWSAGCATGEEPYSVAMALLEAGRAGRGDRILATDVSARALDRAREGRYPAWSLRRLPRELRERWMSGEPPDADVAPAVREPVVYDEAFQLVQEGVAWFGPELHVLVQVMPRVDDTGCNAGGAGSGGAACAMLLLGVFAGRRRRADRRLRL